MAAGRRWRSTGRRVSRALARARWREYRDLLRAAQAAGYAVVSLERWLDGEALEADRVLVLRHDVDRLARSALPMARVEEGMGLTSTWYFRWSTADPEVIARLRAGGHAVGLHYETLSRAVIAGELALGEFDRAAIDQARHRLAGEIAAFQERFGPIASICPHGDTRVPEVHNYVLVRGRGLDGLGVRFDGNEALRGHIAHWATDRTAGAGRWKAGAAPRPAIERGVSPILCLTHPHHWTSGVRLGLDRLRRSA
jgi:hypothetical protein